VLDVIFLLFKSNIISLDTVTLSVNITSLSNVTVSPSCAASTAACNVSYHTLSIQAAFPSVQVLLGSGSAKTGTVGKTVFKSNTIAATIDIHFLSLLFQNFPILS
jgi:hypothetical protein